MKIPKKLLIGVASLLVAAGAFVAVLSATGTSVDALTMESRRDCNYTDVIVNCGTITTEELQYVYNNNIDGASGQPNRGNRDIQAIFSHYGIERSDVFGTNVKKGRLNVDGTITVDGVIVANNAQSVYRAYPGDGHSVTPVTIAGKTFYQGPVAGSYDWAADVFVFYRNGIFHAAVQASCGNPIVATNKITPPPKPPVVTPPAKSCDGLTNRKINRTTYEFTASATATDGSEVKASIVDYTYTFSDGTVKKGGNKITHVFPDKATDQTYTATVVANVKVGDKIEAVDGPNCKTSVTVTGQPSYKCEKLTATQINRLQYKFTATASASNATIKSYTFKFGDGKTTTLETDQKTISTTHTYADKVDNYTAEVIVTMTDGSVAKSPNCTAPIEIKEKETPDISIEKTVNGEERIKVPVGTEFTYEIVVRNTGNVALKNAAVSDKAPSQVTLVSAPVGTIKGNQWTYTIPELKVGDTKKFVIRAKYATYAAGAHVNNVCVVTPTIPNQPDKCDDATTETSEKIEVCDLTTNTIIKIERSEFNESTMTTDLTQCDDMKVCIIETKAITTIKKNEFDESTMTTDLSKCEVVETPPELPQTGIDTFISGGLGLGSITAAGYYWSASRRSLVSALLKK